MFSPASICIPPEKPWALSNSTHSFLTETQKKINIRGREGMCWKVAKERKSSPGQMSKSSNTGLGNCVLRK